MAFQLNFTAKGKAGCTWDSNSVSQLGAVRFQMHFNFSLSSVWFHNITEHTLLLIMFDSFWTLKLHTVSISSTSTSGYKQVSQFKWRLLIGKYLNDAITKNNEIFLSGWNLCSHWFLSYTSDSIQHFIPEFAKIKASIIICHCLYSWILSLFHTVAVVCEITCFVKQQWKCLLYVQQIR